MYKKLNENKSSLLTQYLGTIIRMQTCNEGGNPPADQVVEPHGSVVDVSDFADHTIDVQPFQEEPGEGAQIEEVQQDGDDCAEKLQKKDRLG